MLLRRAATLLVVACLLASAHAQNRRGGRNGRRRNNKNRCRLPGCAKCESGPNPATCEVCRIGFGMTEEKQCAVCGANCKECANAGPGKCDTCKQGFTLDAVSGQCKACAAHCHKCDVAGPGGCNECGPRRMLHVRLELQGEVHECLPCGDGCRACTMEEGCTECQSFYTLSQLPEGAGCAFSWMRVILLISAVFLPLLGCAYCLADDEAPPPRRPPMVQKDATSVVRDDQPDLVRRRGGGGAAAAERPDTSPKRSRHETLSHHQLAGYSGIEIVDDQ